MPDDNAQVQREVEERTYDHLILPYAWSYTVPLFHLSLDLCICHSGIVCFLGFDMTGIFDTRSSS